MENPIKMDDLGGTPIFGNTLIVNWSISGFFFAMDAKFHLVQAFGRDPLGCDGSETPLRGSNRELVILQHVLQHTLLFNLYKKNPTLQEINISHLGKLGKSSSNMPYEGDMLIPWRVFMIQF